MANPEQSPASGTAESYTEGQNVKVKDNYEDESMAGAHGEVVGVESGFVHDWISVSLQDEPHFGYVTLFRPEDLTSV